MNMYKIGKELLTVMKIFFIYFVFYYVYSNGNNNLK